MDDANVDGWMKRGLLETWVNGGIRNHLHIPKGRPLKNAQVVIANEVKQSHKPLIIKKIATAHMRLAMTGSKFFKALKGRMNW